MTDALRDSRGDFFLKLFERQYTGPSYSCPSCSSWITRILLGQRGCEGGRKATAMGVCLTAISFPQWGCLHVILHPVVFAPAKEDLGSQVSPIFLLPLALQDCPFLLWAFSCHCYDRPEPIFQAQQQEARFWQKCPHLPPAAFCPCWGLSAPKYPKRLGGILQRKIPVRPA